MNNKPSYTNGTVTLGGTLTFEQMKQVEGIFKNAALEAATSGQTGTLETVTRLAEIIGVDSATIEDAQTELQEVD